tara:strand:+ start:1207 stop:1917 length:711 start_codon:yes stop_codon:yes gene_type:complete
MQLFKLIAIYFFDLIDIFVHQKRIINCLKKNNINLKIYIDVGSHKGLYTDLIKKHYITQKIFMFEPQKRIFQYIKKKYKKNKKIHIFNEAVSDKNIYQSFRLNHHDLTASLSKLDSKNSYLKLKAKLFGVTPNKMIYETIKIKTITLSNVIKAKKIKKIDLLKIDTEGHEFQVLKGLESKIKRVKYILIEFHNDKIFLKYDPKKVHNYLVKNNFILKNSFKFPFTTWEDRFYMNKL